jgi:hypothetical protein
MFKNTGPAELTIAQIIVNEAVMPFEVSPSVTIPRLGTAVITVKYAWTEGEAYAVRVFTSNAVPFDVVIPVAFETPAPEAKTFWSFTLIGLYVGVIPIFLGILWLPALRALGKQWMTFLMAVTVGLLIFLGLDTLLEALEQAAEVPSTYQGIGLIGIGAVATYMLLEMIGGSKSSDRSESSQRLNIAWRIALGIGIHNLGEDLPLALPTTWAKLPWVLSLWLASSSKTSPRDSASSRPFCVTARTFANLPCWVCSAALPPSSAHGSADIPRHHSSRFSSLPLALARSSRLRLRSGG